MAITRKKKSGSAIDPLAAAREKRAAAFGGLAGSEQLHTPVDLPKRKPPVEDSSSDTRELETRESVTSELDTRQFVPEPENTTEKIGTEVPLPVIDTPVTDTDDFGIHAKPLELPGSVKKIGPYVPPVVSDKEAGDIYDDFGLRPSPIPSVKPSVVDSTSAILPDLEPVAKVTNPNEKTVDTSADNAQTSLVSGLRIVYQGGTPSKHFFLIVGKTVNESVVVPKGQTVDKTVSTNDGNVTVSITHNQDGIATVVTKGGKTTVAKASEELTRLGEFIANIRYHIPETTLFLAGGILSASILSLNWAKDALANFGLPVMVGVVPAIVTTGLSIWLFISSRKDKIESNIEEQVGSE